MSPPKAANFFIPHPNPPPPEAAKPTPPPAVDPRAPPCLVTHGGMVLPERHIRNATCGFYSDWGGVLALVIVTYSGESLGVINPELTADRFLSPQSEQMV